MAEGSSEKLSRGSAFSKRRVPMTSVHKTRIYFAPCHATSEDSRISPCGSTIAAFKNAVKREYWPYDNGDDPSFYASRKFGGQLSWGICRQDVRNKLHQGDMVVFFSFRKFKETGDSEYRLCALATVDRKVRQIDLWHDTSLENYRKYFNLLIRSQAVRRLTLEVGARSNGRNRSLRIRNSQRPHRHIVFESLQSEAENWRDEFVDLLSKRK